MRPECWSPRKKSDLVRRMFVLAAVTFASVSAGLAGEGGSHGGGHSGGHDGGHSGSHGTGHAGGYGGGHASSGYGHHPYGHNRVFRDRFFHPHLGLGAYYYGAPRAYYPSTYAYASDVGYVDLDVYPVEAEVYLGGEYIGTADEFDSDPDYLQVSPGRHTLELGLEGFLTYRMDLNVRPGATLRIPRNLRPAGSSDRGY